MWRCWGTWWIPISPGTRWWPKRGAEEIGRRGRGGSWLSGGRGLSKRLWHGLDLGIEARGDGDGLAHECEHLAAIVAQPKDAGKRILVLCNREARERAQKELVKAQRWWHRFMPRVMLAESSYFLRTQLDNVQRANERYRNELAKTGERIGKNLIVFGDEGLWEDKFDTLRRYGLMDGKPEMLFDLWNYKREFYNVYGKGVTR